MSTSTSSIRAVLPDVVWESTRVHLHDPLHRSEVEHIQRAVQKRRDEFETVRACARKALRRVGRDRPAMVPGSAGATPWPAGIVGSMTHTNHYCAAAVASRDLITGLGIDAEQNQPLPDGVLDLISATVERAELRALAVPGGAVAWDRLLFSAKESVYKAWYPEIGTWLGFEDVEVRIDDKGTFTVRPVDVGLDLRGAQLLERLTGHWWADAEHIVTAALAPA